MFRHINLVDGQLSVSQRKTIEYTGRFLQATRAANVSGID